MLEELLPFISRIPTSYSISMPRLQSYLQNVQRGVTQLIYRNDRFVTDPIPSAGIDFINSLIVRADIPYLLKFENDITRFMKVAHEYKSAVYSDFIRQYPVHEKSFIYGNKKSTVEYLLITEDFDIIENIPMGSNNFDDWWYVRPLHMLSNDSSELQLDIVSSRLRYHKDPPTEAVFSINIIKLLMVYTKYRKLYPEQFTENINNYPFIYKVCLLPLLYDNVRNWITKIIYDITMLKSYDPSERYDTSDLVIGEKSTFVLGSRQSALLEIEDLIQKCALGIVKPDEVVNSLYIEPKWSILDEMKWMMDSHYMGRNIQYKWAEFEREYFVLTTILGLYRLQPESNRSLELRKLFDIIARRMKNTRFWTQVGNPFIANHIKTKFNIIETLMDY